MLFYSVIVISITSLTLVIGINEITAHIRHDFNEMYEDVNAAETLLSTSVGECAMMCLFNARCVSFFFNAVTWVCILHPDPFLFTSPSKTAPGWKIYITRDRSGRCPGDFYYYRQLDLCYQFGSEVKAREITCSSGDLIRIDSEEKQNYINLVTAAKKNLNSVATCIQGKNTGNGWVYNDGTHMTYFNWAPNAPKSNSTNQLRMIHHLDNKWNSNGDDRNCSYICEHR
ncbi:unnamed protein product [Mytilus edulis]|uniref:C-type lectin domain-containing protein n=1 Tax=Mytilus edulis TaxID=6550 RepID=A0A8S3VE75_MYTED|nr:unnamed protein product [Mytilus edulis]